MGGAAFILAWKSECLRIFPGHISLLHHLSLTIDAHQSPIKCDSAADQRLAFLTCFLE